MRAECLKEGLTRLSFIKALGYDISEHNSYYSHTAWNIIIYIQHCRYLSLSLIKKVNIYYSRIVSEINFKISSLLVVVKCHLFPVYPSKSGDT